MIEHLGSDGRLLKDWLYLPPNAPPGAIYPLVVLGYPTAVWDVQPRGGRPGAEQVDDNEQLLAAQGFAVLAPSLPRRGADFTDGMSPSVLEAVDRASRVPGVDARRVGYWGHSGGGMLGFKLATETKRFSAIIAAAGLSDLVSWRGEMRPSDRIGPDWDFALHGADEWTENGQGGLHATPYTDLGHYIQASPIFSADKITTPMLIVQGDNDSRPFEQSEEMFSALYRLKKDAVFMDFLGEDHCFGSPANIRRYINTGVRFLKRELAPRP
jgi:dipeptidyl aminopeptidase/acylaminoacyl peptidase